MLSGRRLIVAVHSLTPTASAPRRTESASMDGADLSDPQVEVVSTDARARPVRQRDDVPADVESCCPRRWPTDEMMLAGEHDPASNRHDRSGRALRRAGRRNRAIARAAIRPVPRPAAAAAVSETRVRRADHQDVSIASRAGRGVPTRVAGAKPPSPADRLPPPAARSEQSSAPGGQSTSYPTPPLQRAAEVIARGVDRYPLS